jgi:hypothetical protein
VTGYHLYDEGVTDTSERRPHRHCTLLSSEHLPYPGHLYWPYANTSIIVHRVAPDSQFVWSFLSAVPIERDANDLSGGKGGNTQVILEMQTVLGPRVDDGVSKVSAAEGLTMGKKRGKRSSSS